MHTMGFNCLKTAEPQETVASQSPGVPCTHLIGHKTMKKAESTIEPPSGFEPRTTVLGIQCAKRVLARKEKNSAF